MSRVKLYSVIVMLGLLVLLAGACAPEPVATPTPSPPGTSEEVLTSEPSPPMEASDEESQRIAEGFLRSSPTFTFDGSEDTLRLVDTIALQSMPDYRIFFFIFDSRQAGYGDRTGQVLAQVITPHKVAITVDQGQIKMALIDRTWDILTQEKTVCR